MYVVIINSVGWLQTVILKIKCLYVFVRLFKLEIYIQ